MSASGAWSNTRKQTQRAANQIKSILKFDKIAPVVSLRELFALNSRLSGGCADHT